MASILIVDDELKIRNVYSDYLKRRGFDILTASNAIEARELLNQYDVKIVLLDINMPEIDGTELFDVTQMFNKDTLIIICSVRPTDEQRELISGAAGYHDKSEGIKQLYTKITQIINTQN